MSFFEILKKLLRNPYADLDNPQAVIYDKPAPVVWGRIEEAIRTLPAAKRNLQAHTNISNPTPYATDPYHIHVTFTFHHPELQEIRTILPPEHQDLRSTLVFQAFIVPKGNNSELTVRWASSPILANRAEHNEWIKTFSKAFDALIHNGTQIPF